MSQEVQLEQLGVGGDLLIDHVHARLMTQFGMYSVTTPRNDASVSRGQWNLDDAYRYISEAYGGYHWDALHGINLDGGIFLSYIGLFSFYNFDNWAYQPSFVSSNTPWFFNGVRVQIFPTQHLKIEPWFINGWQSYARYGTKPGMGGQIKWTPTNSINIISNNYGYGEDDFGIHGRTRFHTDNSFELKYYDRPESKLDRMAFSFTADAGCESGSGVACTGSSNHKIFTPATSTTPAVYYQKQSFLGWMLYNRFWFDKDKYGLTLGGGQINNPGRYLVLLPPINGATAVTGSAYFPEDPGQPFHGTDGTITWDYMPNQYITFRIGVRLSSLGCAVLGRSRRFNASWRHHAHRDWQPGGFYLHERDNAPPTPALDTRRCPACPTTRSMPRTSPPPKPPVRPIRITPLSGRPICVATNRFLPSPFWSSSDGDTHTPRRCRIGLPMEANEIIWRPRRDSNHVFTP